MSSPKANPSQPQGKFEIQAIPPFRDALIVILNRPLLASTVNLTAFALAFRTALLFPSVQEPWNDLFKPDLPNPEEVSFLVKYPNTPGQQICHLPRESKKREPQPLFLIDGDYFDCEPYDDLNQIDLTSIYNRYSFQSIHPVDDHFEAIFEAVDYQEIDPDHLHVRVAEVDVRGEKSYKAHISAWEYLLKCGEGEVYSDEEVSNEFHFSGKYMFVNGTFKFIPWESNESDYFHNTLKTTCNGKTLVFDRTLRPDVEFGIFEMPTEVYSTEGDQ